MIVITSSATGTITRRSRSAALLKSSWTALPAPSSAPVPRSAVADRVDAVERGLRERVVVEDDVDAHVAARPWRAPARPPTRRRRRSARRLAHLVGGARRRDRDRRRQRARGELALDHLEAGHALDLGLEEPADAVVLLVGQQPEREHREHADGHAEREPGALQHAVADAPPDAARRRERLARAGTRRCGARARSRSRPAIVSSAGSSVTPGEQHARDAERRDRAEPLRRARLETSSSTSIAQITVAPLASSAGPERRSARSIATCLSSMLCSSSR